MFEEAQIPILSDVFVAVAVVVAYLKFFNVSLTPSSVPKQDGKHLRHFHMDFPLPHRRNFDLHAKGCERLD